MKILSLLTLSILVLNSYASIVNIPDQNFKAKLIAEGVDIDGDQEISDLEANAVTALSLNNCGIFELTGIEAFHNLSFLQCNNNSIVHLDLSNQVMLTFLDCKDNQLQHVNLSNSSFLEMLLINNNQLSQLDLSNDPFLNWLDCQNNSLQTLDLTHNTQLIRLNCSSNNLTSLDLTQNTLLTDLFIGSGCYSETNQLLNLDLSNNILLEDINIGGMPSLLQVCVWELPFLPFNFTTLDTEGSYNITYTLNCNTLEDGSISNKDLIHFFPNPCQNKLSITLHNNEPANLKILDMESKVLISIEFNQKAELDMTNYPSGIYHIQIIQNELEIREKVIKF